MKLKQIRNNNLLITYAGKRFLIDPTFELPVPIDDLSAIDAVIITHMHANYYSPCALELFPHDIKLFVQNEEEVVRLEALDFTNVEYLKDYGTLMDGVWVVKVEHSLDDESNTTNEHETCGVILNHLHEKSLYIMGNTPFYETLNDLFMDVSPDVIVANCGVLPSLDDRYLAMKKEDFHEISKSTIESRILAAYMKPLAHTESNRRSLTDFAKKMGFESRFSTLSDGQTYEL